MYIYVFWTLHLHSVVALSTLPLLKLSLSISGLFPWPSIKAFPIFQNTTCMYSDDSLIRALIVRKSR